MSNKVTFFQNLICSMYFHLLHLPCSQVADEPTVRMKNTVFVANQHLCVNHNYTHFASRQNYQTPSVYNLIMCDIMAREWTSARPTNLQITDPGRWEYWACCNNAYVSDKLFSNWILMQSLASRKWAESRGQPHSPCLSAILPLDPSSIAITYFESRALILRLKKKNRPILIQLENSLKRNWRLLAIFLYRCFLSMSRARILVV